MNGSGVLTRAVVSLAFTVMVAAPAHADCNFSAHQPWKSAGTKGLQINAYAVGPTCGTTAVVLTVTNDKGATLWSVSHQAQEISVFAGDEDQTAKGVEQALVEWLSIWSGTTYKSTGDLPDWPKGAEGPTREGEFGFFADENLSRDIYREQRAAKRPLFCFVSGMESETCVIVTSPTLIQEFGGFSFPG